MTPTDPPPTDPPPTGHPLAKLSVRSPADLLAAVPYLIGFHPADSVVVVALRGSKIVFAARGDLPALGTAPTDRDAAARHIAAVVAHQHADSATIVGYGAANQVTPTIEMVGMALRENGLQVLEALRVTDGRYWSYLCDELACCPPEGTAFDPATSEVAATATYAGQVALPDRAALVRQIAPVEGLGRESMRQATDRAESRFRALLRESDGGWAGPDEPAGAGAAAFANATDPGPDPAQVVRAAGTAAVDAAMARYRENGHLSDDEVAWLTVLLPFLPVRDHAWERIGDDEWHLTLWTDVLRRVDPELAAAPASLLAFAAWRAGNGALASVAIGRALRAEPGYSMALLIDEALQRGVPPSLLADWPVAASRPAGGRSARRRTNRRRRRKRVGS